MQASEAAAACAEAKRMLAENPSELLPAAAIFERAAALGSGEATAKLAHFNAIVARVKPDWDKSADLLQRAAELGWSPALDELRLLAGGGEGGPAELRARIDIRALVAPRATEVVRTSPRIRTLKAFFTPAECAWVIARGGGRLQRATVYDRNAGGVLKADARSNSATGFQLADMDLALVLLQQRIANSIGLPKEWFETPALLHYAVGEEFKPHVDYLDPAAAGMAEEFARQGQRLATFLVYLDEDFDGGETEFPRLDYRFKGKTGDALVWANIDRELGPDPRTLHAGRPPTRGEKWLLSQWVRDRPMRAAMG